MVHQERWDMSKPFVSFSLIQEIEFCQRQMKLLTREGLRELSFILDKMLKSIPHPGGSRGERHSLGDMQSFAPDQLRISTRPPWKRDAATSGGN